MDVGTTLAVVAIVIIIHKSRKLFHWSSGDVVVAVAVMVSPFYFVRLEVLTKQFDVAVELASTTAGTEAVLTMITLGIPITSVNMGWGYGLWLLR